MLCIVLQVTVWHWTHSLLSASYNTSICLSKPHHRPHYLPHPSHGFIIYQLHTCAVAVVSSGVSITVIVFTEDGCVFFVFPYTEIEHIILHINKHLFIFSSFLALVLQIHSYLYVSIFIKSLLF